MQPVHSAQHISKGYPAACTAVCFISSQRELEPRVTKCSGAGLCQTRGPGTSGSVTFQFSTHVQVQHSRCWHTRRISPISKLSANPSSPQHLITTMSGQDVTSMAVRAACRSQPVPAVQSVPSEALPLKRRTGPAQPACSACGRWAAPRLARFLAPSDTWQKVHSRQCVKVTSCHSAARAVSDRRSLESFSCSFRAFQNLSLGHISFIIRVSDWGFSAEDSISAASTRL